jgi:hypothetical protein
MLCTVLFAGRLLSLAIELYFVTDTLLMLAAAEEEEDGKEG